MMMINCNTVCRISQFRSFDGSFSEGAALNAVAFAGIQAPTILWTYNLAADPAILDPFFQQHLLMDVYPMAPMPLNDHSIQPGQPVVGQYYRDYAPLFDAMHGARWLLTTRPIQLEVGSLVGDIATQLTLAPCSPALAARQTWVYEADRSLRLGGSSDDCLDVWNCGVQPNTLVDVYACHPKGTSGCGYKNQQFNVSKSTITNANSGACLTLLPSKGQVVASPCVASANTQTFRWQINGSIAYGETSGLCVTAPSPPPAPPVPVPKAGVGNVFNLPDDEGGQKHFLIIIALADVSVESVVARLDVGGATGVATAQVNGQCGVCVRRRWWGGWWGFRMSLWLSRPLLPSLSAYIMQDSYTSNNTYIHIAYSNYIGVFRFNHEPSPSLPRPGETPGFEGREPTASTNVGWRVVGDDSATGERLCSSRSHCVIVSLLQNA